MCWGDLNTFTSSRHNKHSNAMQHIRDGLCDYQHRINDSKAIEIFKIKCHNKWTEIISKTNKKATDVQMHIHKQSISRMVNTAKYYRDIMSS